MEFVGAGLQRLIKSGLGKATLCDLPGSRDDDEGDNELEDAQDPILAVSGR